MESQQKSDTLRSKSARVQLTSVPLPAKSRARRKLAKARGNVPLSTLPETVTDTRTALGSGNLIFYCCDAPASTTTSNDGGTIITNVSLELLFWGSWWNSNPSPSIGQVVNAVNSILQGPYMSGLGQYGVGGGNLKGAWIVTGRDPNNPFSDDDAHSIISDLIDQGSFPEPDDPGGRNLYIFILPANIHSDNPKLVGEHMYDWDYDFPVDYEKTWFGWVSHDGILDTLTANFSHELVEACTDPEGDGVQVNPRDDSNWHEIGDVCCSTGRVNGILVQSYWSDHDHACIIPTFLPPPPQLSVPASLGFGKLPLREPSEPKPLAITNTGAVPQTVTIPHSPPPSANFVWDISGNYQINPGETLELNVKFSPSIIGLNVGELKFTSHPEDILYTVQLTGTGVRGQPR